MNTTYKGIDYGLGRTNIDKSTGIRFGVISQHEVSQAWCDSCEPIYSKPDEFQCAHCKQTVSINTKGETGSDPEINWGDDVDCPNCGESTTMELPDFAEPIGFEYDGEGYQLTDCLDSDIMVIKSPYFTYGQYCSPCVPGAVNLNSPMTAEDGAKAYCLGHDWFEDGKAPYPVYSVETGELVQA